ncbi:hypothetical protein F9C28_13025 [Shimwellia pseudoproteus]|uniref:hypothetical protein n=1 Tax=Shimwellia pseudoproteus TaxID=570012 RepID=UPI0018ECB37A|nr:hypothetical protein [Shimwellia pseudoproteus]MBJ3815829.1 hypothetical protein [Shimwellia pseudoproteus]
MADIPASAQPAEPVRPAAPASAGDAGQITAAHRLATEAARPQAPQATSGGKPPVTDYSAMFAPAAAPASDRAAVRALPLQSVLERIASCR